MTAGGGRRPVVPAKVKQTDSVPDGDPRLALQMMMAKANQREYLDVTIEGQMIRFYYKPMKWTAKSRCVSAATETTPHYNEKTKQLDIQAKIHFDIYMRECLKAMIVDPPIPFTDTVIDCFPPEVGSQFESIIPDLFDTTEKIEATKKGSKDSSDGEQALDPTP